MTGTYSEVHARPTLKVLNEEQIEKIHAATLEVLERTCVRITHPRALELLERAVALDADHWQSWYNTVIVLHYDLHRHDEAVAALERLKEIAATNSDVPDLSTLEAEVSGS